MLKPKAISLQAMDFQLDIFCWMFLHYLCKGNFQNKDKFCQNNMMNCESGVNNFM